MRSRNLKLRDEAPRFFVNLTYRQKVATVITVWLCKIFSIVTIVIRSWKQVMKKQPRVQSIKLVSIGNSKGVRLPKLILQKYGFSDELLLEETEQGILLRKVDDVKLSWEQTYREMAQEREDWQDFENIVLDGLEMDEVAT